MFEWQTREPVRRQRRNVTGGTTTMADTQSYDY